MSTRSYSNLIVMESIFDSIPTSDGDVLSLASSVFEPFVQVVSDDCGTTLGQIVDVNFELEGKVELSTNQVFSYARISQLLAAGVYKTSVRELGSCIESGGICRRCYHASRQYDPIPNIGDVVKILPEYVTYTETLSTRSGDKVLPITQAKSLYDRIYVYYTGILLNPAVYTVTDTNITLSTTIPADGNVVVRYTSYIRAPYLFWLATTYSGSILGIKELPALGLVLRKRLLTSLLPLSVIELVSAKVADLKGVPSEVKEYLPGVEDPLEKALLAIAINSIYLNVS